MQKHKDNNTDKKKKKEKKKNVQVSARTWPPPQATFVIR
jgi:hypothetical protein